MRTTNGNLYTEYSVCCCLYFWQPKMIFISQTVLHISLHISYCIFHIFIFLLHILCIYCIFLSYNSCYKRLDVCSKHKDVHAKEILCKRPKERNFYNALCTYIITEVRFESESLNMSKTVPTIAGRNENARYKKKTFTISHL